MNFYESGSIVWVKLSQHWWPGSVKSPDDCPIEYIKNLKKDPLAIVKFFNEPGFHHVTKQEQIFSYNCNKKMDFIKKGLSSAVKSTGMDLCKKFEEDIAMAEKLTGGNMDIIKDVKEQLDLSKKGKRIDYSNMGFGQPKVPKVQKKTKDENHQKKGFTNIGESILYKRENGENSKTKTVEHVVKILEQPKLEIIKPTNFYKCSTCGFTCSRLNVIIWHNKNHLKVVFDYDSGIKVPYRRKRKSKAVKNKPKNKKMKLSPDESVSHSQTNGHSSPSKALNETKQLLLDWEDDEESGSECEPVNGVEETNGVDEEESEEDDDDYDEDYPLSQPRKERQPMPLQADINTAFDALLADSSPLNVTPVLNNYVNNDSDSEGSWDKYYDREDSSDSEAEKESDIKDICGKKSSNGIEKKEAKDEKQQQSKETPPEDQSSNSSTSSGPAYMLVAVDAHGNNVPMPVLSEGGNHLVAVEASMEDGTTRTLYIDPAHLGPNVDLNNLMLHIDNSGQETVIIPTSTSDGEIISSTLVDQNSQSSNEEGDKKSVKIFEDSSHKRKSVKDGESSDGKSPAKSIEMKVSKLKKSPKISKEKSKEELPESSDQPDILSDSESNLSDEPIPFDLDEIVYAMTHGIWWPSYVVKLFPKERKASILYINCQQATPMKVGVNKMKAFKFSEFPEIFESQKDKAVGLTDAMEMANGYKSLQKDKLITDPPKQFFNLSITEQKLIIGELNLTKRGSTPTKEKSSKDEEHQKAKAVAEARRLEMEKYFNFIRSSDCLEHLRKVCKEVVPSKRHDDFLFFSHQLHYWNDLNKRHNTGHNFFCTEDTKQVDQIFTFLGSQLMESDLGFLSDNQKKEMYVKLVLFPEAIKEALRRLTSIEEKKLEVMLVRGILRLEKKAE